MYRPSMYDKHDKTMLNFAERFNRSPICKNIEMRPHPVETFDNDGIIDFSMARKLVRHMIKIIKK